jgi:uncharacterized protein
MFTFTITAYINHLTNLRAILDKAKVWQGEHKISDETIMNARLSLDQFSLTGQVRSACNFARNSAAVIRGLESPSYEDNEKSLSDLQARIDKVISYLKEVTEDSIKNDLETRMVPLAWMPGKGLTAKYFLEVYALSNFYFHYTTAYAILRHYGLPIGKADYMGHVDLKDIAKV